MATTREDKLLERMAALGIRDEDMVESFTRSSGPGGQNVNKTSSAVVLVHRPTGLQVRCEQERSQAQNRLLAREWLLGKIEGRIRALREKEQAQREKLRRQTRKRSRGAKERILRDKARHSSKKRLRQGGQDEY